MFSLEKEEEMHLFFSRRDEIVEKGTKALSEGGEGGKAKTLALRERGYVRGSLLKESIAGGRLFGYHGDRGLKGPPFGKRKMLPRDNK